MDGNSIVPFKIYLFTNDLDEPEVRRFGLPASCVNSYSFLTKNLSQLFSKLSDKLFTLSWKDEEGDEVAISSDDELLIALTSMKTDLKKFYIRLTSPVNGPAGKMGNALHFGVNCDVCDCTITGYRYKCLICNDYDLCSNCEQAGNHSNHIMLRIPDPNCFENMNVRKLIHFMKSCISEMKNESECQYSCKKRRKHEKRRSCPMAEAMSDFPHFKYLDWGVQSLKQIIDPFGATIAVHLSGKEEEKEKKEKKEEKQQKENTKPTPSPEKNVKSQDELSESLKQKISEITKILANQSISIEAEDDGWTAFEELKKCFEEPRPSTSEGTPEGPTAKPSAPLSEAEEAKTNLYPNLTTQQPAEEDRVKNALEKMLSMGFTNEGNWLGRLLEAKGGSIDRALESLCPSKSSKLD